MVYAGNNVGLSNYSSAIPLEDSKNPTATLLERMLLLERMVETSSFRLKRVLARCIVSHLELCWRLFEVASATVDGPAYFLGVPALGW